MLAFVTGYSPPDSSHYAEQYRRCALAGIERQNYEWVTRAVLDAKDGLAAVGNMACDLYADLEGLQALVLLHADLELLDPKFCTKLLAAFADPEVAVVGLIGASNVTSIAWWEGKGVGRMHHGPAAQIQPGVYFQAREGEVDAVDGCLVALSPWAVKNLRFDEEMCPRFHGWEVDFCTLAQSKGKKVVVIDSEARHHTKGGYGDRVEWERCNAAYRKKWGRFLLRRRS